MLMTEFRLLLCFFLWGVGYSTAEYDSGVSGWSSQGGKIGHDYFRRIWQIREDTGRIPAVMKIPKVITIHLLLS